MAEQRDDGTPGTETGPGSPSNDQSPGNAVQPPQLPAAPAGGANLPAAPAGGDQLNAEELQQFRQFQQFQDYLRFTQAQQGNQPAQPPDAGLVPAAGQQPQPLPQPGHGAVQPWAPGGQVAVAEKPRRKAPRWLVWLAKKVLGWVVAVVLLGILASWAYHHFFPDTQGQTSQQVAQNGGGTWHTNEILPTDPHVAVHAIYDIIGKDPNPDSRGKNVCGSMSADAQRKFAADLRAADCGQAATMMHDQVHDLNAYIYALPANVSEPPAGKRVTIYSCQYPITGGPSLGTFTLELQPAKGQWLIVDHAPDPATCPAPSSEPLPTR